MKKILLSFVIVLSTIACSQAQKTEFTPEALNSVMIATDKSETTFQKVLDANKGKIVVIDVWASWCSDCIKGFPKYKELQAKFPEVTYLYISMDKEWENFTKHFDKVHSDFVVSLKEKHPTITGNEVKLCAYLRMNLSTNTFEKLK